jgi:hypothetical protein
MNRPSWRRCRGRRGASWRCLGSCWGRFDLSGGCVLFQFVEDLKIIVRGVEFGAKRAPNPFLESDIDLSQLIGGKPQRNDVTHPHHDGVRNDLHAFRRKILDKTGFDQVVVNFVERPTLVVTQDHGQHDFPVVGRLLGAEQERDEKKPAEQGPFHGLCLAWVGEKPSRKDPGRKNSRKVAKVQTKKECKFWVGQPSLFDEVRLRQKLLDKLFETEGSSFSTDFSSKMT